MTINTEYNIEDKFFHIKDSKITERRIKRINVTAYIPTIEKRKTSITITYKSTNMNGCNEMDTRDKVMYRTKQEAGDAWMKEQGLKGSKE